jgi:hypothetical protein
MQPPPVPVHRRQLILGPTAAQRGWCTTELPGTGVLTYAPELPVAVVRDADGMAWCLAGLARQSDPGSRDPTDQLVRARTAHVPSLYQSWAGRWMLVGAGEVHLDATGLLGCLYARGPDGACWMSTSAALLAELWGPSHVTRDARALRHARGLDWIPAPGSRHPPIRRLLPSRILDVRSGSTRPRSWLRGAGSGLPYAAILELLQARLGEPLRRLGTNEVWVPLTGGQDSRLVLALALAAGLKIHAYTNERDMTLADRLLPRRVARAAGVPYAFHRPGPANHARGISYDMHGPKRLRESTTATT